MKNLFIAFIAIILISGCTPKPNDLVNSRPVVATIDLVNVTDDKVMVEMNPGRFTNETVTFFIPKTVPGTYSTDNYGQYIEDFKALSYTNELLEATQIDENSWQITNAPNLDKITYWVNDTYDSEKTKEEPVFSPAGTNIEKDTNFVLNLHNFVGYFNTLENLNYELRIKSPNNLEGYTTLNRVEAQENLSSENHHTDIYLANRYFEVIDNPILYTTPDSETFIVNDIAVTLSVYSPNKIYTATSIKKEMEKMMKAQKAFLGDINSTKKYNILLYLSSMDKDDARGFGALEHHTSTTVVLPESIPAKALADAMVDVVSHEFFHIVTPLSVHSEEIHNFNYNNPKMSKHLWMYEGVTEYFANLFQINQGLIGSEEFYNRLMTKIERADSFDDNMSFTEMSKNILEEPYKENYANVYEKGALIGMCLDLIIREQSNGEKGILWLMKQLSQKYGKNRPFKDDEIIPQIVALTYPEVGTFFETHVVGNTPINYEKYFSKVGLTFGMETQETGFLFQGQEPFINVNESTKEIFIRSGIPLNSFFTELQLMPEDVIKKINGMEYSLDNIRDMVGVSFTWKPGDTIEFMVKRKDEEMIIKGEIVAPVRTVRKLQEDANASTAQVDLRNSWFRN
ncbi:peptidase M61 [Ascidiimonas sp. W6]|uniref:M61 family metallopeptidase n=1 Tax=Ascidiimonas meishanensis TaxID=3128903 RepID=UPI0030EEE98F